MIVKIASSQNTSPDIYTIKGVRERGDHADTKVVAVGSLLEEKLVNVANAECKVAGWTFALSRIYSSVDTPMRPCVSGEIMFVCFRYLLFAER